MTTHRFGTGPRNILALHCALAHGGAWRGLTLPGCAVTAPDLLGHGDRSLWDGVGDYHSRATRDVMGVLDGPSKPAAAAMDIVGHSFGATIALRIALERPELVRSLVLIEPVLFAAARSVDPAAFSAYETAFEPFATAIAAGDMAGAAAFFHGYWSGPGFSALPEKARTYMQARISLIVAQTDVLHGDAAGMLGYMRLEALGIPTLLIEGDQSPPIIGVIQTELARRLPQVERVVITGAGHMAPITDAIEVSKAVAVHLARVSDA